MSKNRKVAKDILGNKIDPEQLSLIHAPHTEAYELSDAYPENWFFMLGVTNIFLQFNFLY